MKKKINSRSKGANGEREAAKWLQQKFKLKNTPERNLEQVRSGGHDLTGFDPFCVEVKRCQVLNLRDWWLQAVFSAKREHMIPVVMFRRNKEEWEFLISANNIGLSTGFIRLKAREFHLWASKILESI